MSNQVIPAPRHAVIATDVPCAELFLREGGITLLNLTQPAIEAALNGWPTTSELVTSAASPPMLNPNVGISYVISGGSGGAESVRLPPFPLDGGGNNTAMNGTLHVVKLFKLANPADVVSVAVYDNGTYDGGGPSGGLSAFIQLNGASIDGLPTDEGPAEFVWHINSWYLYG
jgi:hypothetical protein